MSPRKGRVTKVLPPSLSVVPYSWAKTCACHCLWGLHNLWQDDSLHFTKGNHKHKIIRSGSVLRVTNGGKPFHWSQQLKTVYGVPAKECLCVKAAFSSPYDPKCIRKGFKKKKKSLIWSWDARTACEVPGLNKKKLHNEKRKWKLEISVLEISR